MQVNVTWKEFTELMRTGEAPLGWIKRTGNILTPQDRTLVEQANAKGEEIFLVPHVNLPSQRVQCVP